MSGDRAREIAERAVESVGAAGAYDSRPEMRKLPEVKAVIQADDDLRRACLIALADISAGRDQARAWVARELVAIVAGRKLELDAAHVQALLACVRDAAAVSHRGTYFASELLKGIAKPIEAAADGWTDDERAELAPLLEEASALAWDPKLASRLRMLAGGDDGLLEGILDTDDFGPRARTVLEGVIDAGTRRALMELLTGLPQSGKPSKAWLADAASVRDAFRDPADPANALLETLLDAGDDHDALGWLDDRNERIAVAITHFAGVVGSPSSLERLRRLAMKAITGTEPGAGPRSLKVANAAAEAIAAVDAPASLTELLALERSVRHGTLLKAIRKAIGTLADTRGMTRDELLEQAVERHGLDPAGSRTEPLSRGSARVVVDARSARIVFVDEHGTERKTFPAAVKDETAPLREELKAIRRTIAGERHRLDAAMAVDRRWPMEQWRRHYLDHPITGRLARALIWGFGDVLGIPSDDEVLTAGGDMVPLPADGEVRLWHPIHSAADDVRAWRQRLLDDRIAQPFKQAFRETYSLTPAERETKAYSNRFAQHVFGQVQARSLMKGRGWSPVPLAWWDDGIDHGVARRTYEPFGITAEFFYDPITEMAPDGDLYPYCTSDQVRFLDGDDPVPLPDVPLLVFTEAMRDVDLFVSVTSIGMDPEWPDRGAPRRFATYWESFSFGELGEAAQTRREVLGELIPSLAIADQCELHDRYLTVRGSLREYRIHLGSANVLMSPDDRYLCIVASRHRRAGRLFLPFDDDPVLSVILSKAFLLADDANIADETIKAQIRR